MLHKCFLPAALCCCLFQPLTSFGQSSQDLNNQGCEALVKHDCIQAEKLFIAAYSEAVKAHDSKRMRAALSNLKELYASQGRDDKVKRVDGVAAQLEHPAVRQTGAGFGGDRGVSMSEPFGPDQLVRSFVKSNGVFVPQYHRTGADGDPFNNYSTRGNVNPYTGKPGYVNPYSESAFHQSPGRSPFSSEQPSPGLAHSIKRLMCKSNTNCDLQTGCPDIRAFAHSRQLDSDEMVSIIKGGGAIIELDNGCVIEAVDFDQSDWQLGDRVDISDHGSLASSFVSLVNQDGHVLGGKVVALH